MPDVEIVSGADLVPGKAEKFFKDFGIEGAKCYPSHKELIDANEVDAVCICTYNKTHAECAIYALEHEDGLMSPKEGLEKAIKFLQDVIIFEQSGEAWWI